ncbi:MAG: hypothetical protein J6E49_06725, partial [Acidaminococcaceae bacterium]|nr:hypothetical protein [Acidaminococcaceae bacterium]
YCLPATRVSIAPTKSRFNSVAPGFAKSLQTPGKKAIFLKNRGIFGNYEQKFTKSFSFPIDKTVIYV